MLGESVEKIRELKKRDGKPFSVIAPSKEWVWENCVDDEKVEAWLSKLPGPYTFILELKNKNCVAGEVNCFGESLGVRIPDHFISKIVEKAGVAFVTTSVNVSGEKPVTEIDEIADEMRGKIDIAINQGELKGEPSKVVFLVKGEEKVLREL
ncbi:MAG: Sua5/YciO/YrdC/YwlC family protein [Nanoarchaeota archaeon]